MNKETEKALRGSIRKWEKIVAGTDSDKGSKNCSLCKRFRPFGSAPCTVKNVAGKTEKCPVFKAVGEPYCCNTPYEEWQEAHQQLYGVHAVFNARAHDNETVMCAVLELEFLKDLLPKEKE